MTPTRRKANPRTALRADMRECRQYLIRMVSCGFGGCPERNPDLQATALGDYLKACRAIGVRPRIPRSLRRLQPLFVRDDQTMDDAKVEQNWSST